MNGYGSLLLTFFCATCCIFLVVTSCATKAVKRGSQESSSLMSTYCAKCHNLPNPKNQTDSAWTVIMENHRNRAKLTVDQYKRVLEYLIDSN